MAEIILNANGRKTIRKSDNKKLRRNGRVPGVYYYKQNEPLSIEVSESSLKPLIYTSEAHMVSLQMENQPEMPCILKDVQFDPISDKIVHFDLQGITRGEVMELEVPVILKGSAIGLKKGGILQQILHKLDIECLPKDIPEHLEIDITNLDMNHSIHVSDLNFENMTILNSVDSVIVSVVAPKIEKEALPEGQTEKSLEPEVISKGKAEKEEK